MPGCSSTRLTTPRTGASATARRARWPARAPPRPARGRARLALAARWRSQGYRVLALAERHLPRPRSTSSLGPNRCRRSATSSGLGRGPGRWPALPPLPRVPPWAARPAGPATPRVGPRFELTFSSRTRSAITNCAFRSPASWWEVTLLPSPARRCHKARPPGRQGRGSAWLTERSLRSARPFTTWSPTISTGTLARAASLVATLPSRTLDIPAPLAPTTSKP